MSAQERGMLKTATRCSNYIYVEPYLSTRVNQPHTKIKLGGTFSLVECCWLAGAE